MKQTLTLLLCSLSIIFGTTTRAAERPAFLTDITHGNIRCVLMSVGQTTVFPNEKDKEHKTAGWHKGQHGVPCFTVTFLIEALAGAPSEPKTLKRLDVFSAGKPVQMKGNSYDQWFDYNTFPAFLDFNLPEVANQKRSFILRYVQFSSLSNLQPLKLIIEAGFEKDIEKFEFDSIRLQ